jgi:hypothetical protein
MGSIEEKPEDLPIEQLLRGKAICHLSIPPTHMVGFFVKQDGEWLTFLVSGSTEIMLVLNT